MNKLLFPLLISSVAGLSTVIGYFFIYFKRNISINKFISLSLSISLVIMFYLSIFDLIPTGFLNIIRNAPIVYTILITIIAFGSGVVVTELINPKKEDNLLKLGYLSMIALILHNIPEGIITFITSIENQTMGLKIALGILCHNIPEGICIGVPIYYATKNKKKAFFYTLISGLSEPIGGLLVYLLFKNYINIFVLSIIYILVGGMMINLSINKIYKEIKTYHEYPAMIVGIGIALLLIILMNILI